jgi:hypothetical protein
MASSLQPSWQAVRESLTFYVSMWYIPPMLSSQFRLWNGMCSSVQRTKIFHYTFTFIPKILSILSSKRIQIRSQKPRRLSNMPAATRFVGLWVRIPPVAGLPLFCEWCLLSVRVLCDRPIPHPESPTNCVCAFVCVCVCVCVSLSVIRRNYKPLQLQWVVERVQKKKESTVRAQICIYTGWFRISR